MMTEITRELTAIKNTNAITSKQVLACTRRIEAQSSQKALIKGIRENKVLNAVKKGYLDVSKK